MTKVIRDILSGTTKVSTWVNSGVTPSAISVAVYNSSESLVSSSTMSSSGNGHYYKPITFPETPGFYMLKWKSTIGGDPYIDKMFVRVIRGEVD